MPEMRYEIYWSRCLIGRPPEERVVARCHDLRAAKAITDALSEVYISHVGFRLCQDIITTPTQPTR